MAADHGAGRTSRPAALVRRILAPARRVAGSLPGGGVRRRAQAALRAGRVRRAPRLLSRPEWRGELVAEPDWPRRTDRLAVLAHWSPEPAQSRSVRELIAQLQEHGYTVLVVSTADTPHRLRFEGPGPEVDLARVGVVRRANVGYDFGSWAVGLQLAGDRGLLGARHVLLVNDSLVGPFADLGPILTHFEATGADVWGMVESAQVESHLQSYFRGFTGAVLRDGPLRDYWADIRALDDKQDIIDHGEVGFGRVLAQHRFTTDQFLHHTDVDAGELNPMIHRWRRVLAAGVPFVKRELFCFRQLAADGDELAGAVRARYGTAIEEWV